MISAHTQIEVILRYPEVRQDDVFVVLILRREYQHKGRNIRGGGQVQATVADTAFQIVFADGEFAFVPFIHGHPANRLFDPLVETKLSEGVLFAGILFCRFTGILDLVDANRDAEGRICLLPDRWICPVVRLLCTVNNRIKGVVDLSSVNDVLGFLVYLIADGLRIVAGRGDKEIQRLHTGIAGAFCHDIKELAVRLRVQLIEYHAVGVETVLVAYIGGEHLLDTARWLIDEPLLGIQYLDPLGERRTHPHHISRHIKHDGCLLTISRTAIDLGSFLTVTAAQ